MKNVHIFCHFFLTFYFRYKDFVLLIFIKGTRIEERMREYKNDSSISIRKNIVTFVMFVNVLNVRTLIENLLNQKDSVN